MSKKKRIVRISDIIIKPFQPLFNDKEHIHKIISSGRAGTKSSYGAIHAVEKIVEDPNCAVVYMRKFHNKLEKTVYKECIRAIPRLGLKKRMFKITKKPMQITYKKNGNTIYFTGNDSIDDTKGMIDEDSPIKLVILDELTEFFERGQGEDELANIEATFIRGNDSEFSMEYYYNPPKNAKAPILKWVNKMKKREDAIHIHVDYRDVPVKWLGQKLIDSALAMKKADETMYKWIWLGISTGVSEVVYYMFNEKKHINSITEKDCKNLIHVGIAIDYGQLNATTFQAFGLDQSKVRVQGIAEYYHSGRESMKQKAPSEYAKDFKTFYSNVTGMLKKGQRIEAVIIDPSARGLAEEIKRIMPAVRIVPANNTVKLGIERTQKLIAFDKFRCSKTQEHLIEEFGQYAFNKDLLDKGKEEVVKVNDHTMDCLRYYVMTMWTYLKFLLPVTERGDNN